MQELHGVWKENMTCYNDLCKLQPGRYLLLCTIKLKCMIFRKGKRGVILWRFFSRLFSHLTEKNKIKQTPSSWIHLHGSKLRKFGGGTLTRRGKTLVAFATVYSQFQALILQVIILRATANSQLASHSFKSVFISRQLLNW